MIEFHPGDIVVQKGPYTAKGIRFLVQEWKPGWISLVRARKDGKPDRRNIGFTAGDLRWEIETPAKKDGA